MSIHPETTIYFNRREHEQTHWFEPSTAHPLALESPALSRAFPFSGASSGSSPVPAISQ